MEIFYGHLEMVKKEQHRFVIISQQIQWAIHFALDFIPAMLPSAALLLKIKVLLMHLWLKYPTYLYGEIK